MVEPHFCLRWNNYCTNITAEFETLREGEHFVDVTLACDGRQIKAHKVVLSACSPYFKELLQGNPCTHPIIILRDVAYGHMRSLLEFMYQGEVNISQAHLGSFLQTAEALKIRGLAESPDDRNEKTGGSSLSAFKTSLNSLGGISPNLVPPLLERSVGSHPIPISETHAPSHSPMIGSSHSLLGLSYPPSISAGLSSPIERGNVPELHSPSSYLSQGQERSKGDPSDRRDTMSPISLPPNKRLRISDRRSSVMTSASKVNNSANAASPHNGCSNNTSTNNVLSVDTATLKHGTVPPDPANSMEEYPETVPKVEPVEHPLSDTEESGGWGEDDARVGGGGDQSRSPGPTHSSQWNQSTPSDHPDAPSHLLTALSSESHLQDEVNNPPPDLMAHGFCQSVSAPSREVPRSCPYCAKLISNFYNLKKHITTMHQAPTFYHACQHCSATFRTPEYLRKHLVNVHKYPVKKKK